MLKHQSAIVTCSTNGIGLGVARALAKEGVDILLSGAGDRPEIEFTRLELQRQFGVKVRFSEVDPSSPAQIRALAELAQAEFGKIDIIINNAGVPRTAPVETLADEDWDAVLASRLSAAFHLIKAVAPGMKSRRYGRIINIGSVLGLTALPFKSACVAANHGLIGLSKAVAVELAAFGITSNAICPAAVRMPLIESQMAAWARVDGPGPDPSEHDLALTHQARKEFVRVEELAALVVYLASDAAASMTGTAMALDGGWSLH
jgi:3-hydroxybutyrate dehydrogenase